VPSTTRSPSIRPCTGGVTALVQPCQLECFTREFRLLGRSRSGPRNTVSPVAPLFIRMTLTIPITLPDCPLELQTAAIHLAIHHGSAVSPPFRPLSFQYQDNSTPFNPQPSSQHQPQLPISVLQFRVHFRFSGLLGVSVIRTHTAPWAHANAENTERQAPIPLFPEPENRKNF
jgi:hypothetical protein